MVYVNEPGSNGALRTSHGEGPEVTNFEAASPMVAAPSIAEAITLIKEASQLTEQPLDAASDVLVGRLLDGETDVVRTQALGHLAELSAEQKTRVASHILLRVLLRERNGWQRTWCISGLAASGVDYAAELLTKCLDPRVEGFEWARCFAAVGLARLGANNLKEGLGVTLSDPSPLVRATGLRLLIGTSDEDEYVEKLLNLGESDHVPERLAACRALRRDVGVRPLSDRLESKLVPVLLARLQDRYELADVRFQAARALGGVEHRKADAIRGLCRALEDNLPDWIRLICVNALREINQPETRNALLVALHDSDAEIRVRAADALKVTLGVSQAVSFLVDTILQEEQPRPPHINALREIDPEAATVALAKQLLHPDPKVSARASQVLANLGGEAAMRALQVQRTKALDRYTDLLGNADQQIMQQFESIMRQARLGFTLSLGMHATIFAIGVVALVCSVALAMRGGSNEFDRWLGVGGTVGSAGTLLLLFYRNPLENIRRSVTSLIEVDVVFLGYVRQINQIDATFKQMFVSADGFGTNQMKKTVEQIQASVQATMTQIKSYLSPEPIGG